MSDKYTDWGGHLGGDGIELTSEVWDPGRLPLGQQRKEIPINVCEELNPGEGWSVVDAGEGWLETDAGENR